MAQVAGSLCAVLWGGAGRKKGIQCQDDIVMQFIPLNGRQRELLHVVMGHNRLSQFGLSRPSPVTDRQPGGDNLPRDKQDAFKVLPSGQHALPRP